MPQTFLTSKREVGFVTSAIDYLLYLEGLPTTRINDIIISENGGRAIVIGLDREKVEALMLDQQRPKPGSFFSLYPKGIQLPLATASLFGRAISALGMSADGGPNLPPGGKTIDLDAQATGIDSRQLITEQFITGITIIDTLLPIGKGQRELVFGEPRSGKSTALLDIILHQKGKNIICIYAALGKAESDIKKLIQNIKVGGADSYTIVLAATSNVSAPLIGITPSVAFAVAEHFRTSNKDVLLVLDDLGTHAKYLREISLLTGRIPGRESYPPDLFYQYSHHIERAGNFNNDFGGGSITLLPVVETDMENFTSFVPTTLMSITDGHLLFTAALRAQGRYPAIEVDRSVTRVGHQTQPKLLRIVADKIRSLLVNYHELERYSRFGSELSQESQLTIRRGMKVTELLRQEPMQNIEPEVQILLLLLVFTEMLDTMETDVLKSAKIKIIETLKSDTFKPLRDHQSYETLDAVINDLKAKTPLLLKLCQT